MAFTPEDEARLKALEAQKKSNKTGKLINRLEQDRIDLLNKQTEAQKKQNELAKKNFQLGSKAQRQATAFAQKEQKLIDQKEKSLSSILQNIVKGNFSQAFGLDKTNDLRKKEISLATKAKEASREILKTEGLTASQRVELQDLTKDITEGVITEKEEIGERITAIEVEGDAKKSILKSAQGTFKAQTDVSGALGKSNARMKLLKMGSIGVTAAFAAAFAIAQKFAGSIDAIGKQFGSLNVLGDGFKNELLTSQEAVIGIGASLEDVIATTNELSSEFGLSIDEAADLSAQVIDTARAVGLSNEEAAKLSGILQTTSGLSGAQAERLTEGAFQLAAMNRVNPSAVLKDMAGSSEAFAMFSKDGGDNMAKAAVQARALGLSLDTTSKIAEGLLDFEQSIGAEVEASVLLGRQLNFQKARELALTNDLEGAMKEVVKQVGTEAEFNKLMLPQRQALAKSIGVSVGDLAKMVANQDKANMLAGETAKSFADIIGKDAMSELTATMNELKIFGVAIANTVGPLLMLVAKVANIALTPLGNLVSGISQTIRGVNDFKSGPGGITTMMGPAGVFSLNPRDSVLATTNPIPVNDISMSPAGSKSVGGGNMNVTFGDATFQNDKLRLAVVNPPDTTRSL